MMYITFTEALDECYHDVLSALNTQNESNWKSGKMAVYLPDKQITKCFRKLVDFWCLTCKTFLFLRKLETNVRQGFQWATKDMMLSGKNIQIGRGRNDEIK